MNTIMFSTISKRLTRLNGAIWVRQKNYLEIMLKYYRRIALYTTIHNTIHKKSLNQIIPI